jgi:hypothetical protein
MVDEWSVATMFKQVIMLATKMFFTKSLIEMIHIVYCQELNAKLLAQHLVLPRSLRLP